MELRHLRYAVALADALSFRKAAASLNISQPPLSMQIQQLEDEIGTALFTRSKRKVELTPAGKLFTDQARSILALVQKAAAEAREAGLGRAGTLSVGFVGSTVFSLLPKIIKRFRKQNPGVQLRLLELSTMEQLEALRAGEIDVAVMRSPPKDPDIARAIVLEDEIVLALPQQHPLARQEKIQLKELANESFVTFPRLASPELFDTVISHCQKAGFSPRIVQEAREMTTIVGLVAAEVGVALIPESVSKFKIEGVRYEKLADRRIQVNFTFCVRRDAGSAVVRDFLDSARETISG